MRQALFTNNLTFGLFRAKSIDSSILYYIESNTIFFLYFVMILYRCDQPFLTSFFNILFLIFIPIIIQNLVMSDSLLTKYSNNLFGSLVLTETHIIKIIAFRTIYPMHISILHYRNLMVAVFLFLIEFICYILYHTPPSPHNITYLAYYDSINHTKLSKFLLMFFFRANINF